MKLWHRHLVLQGKAKREGRLARRPEPSGCYHYWQLYDRAEELFRCRCGATLTKKQMLALGPQSNHVP